MNPAMRVLVVLCAAGGLAACAMNTEPKAPAHTGEAVLGLGQPFLSSQGEVFILRVQDEYRMIRCVPQGPIAGCYEDVFRIQRDSLSDSPAAAPGHHWNEWISVSSIPGLEVSFLAPDRVAMRQQPVLLPSK